MEAATKNTQSLKTQEAAIQQVSQQSAGKSGKASLGKDRQIVVRVVTKRVKLAIGVVAATTSQLSAYTLTLSAIIVARKVT